MNPRKTRKSVETKGKSVVGHGKPKYPPIMRDERMRQAFAAVAFILSVALIAFILSLSVSGLLKFLASALVLGLNGSILAYLLGLEGDLGLIILRIKGGTEKIEELSKKFGKYWNEIADIGLVLGFGLSSKFAFKHVSWGTFIKGMILFLMLAFIVLPNSAGITLSVINIPYESLQTSSNVTWLSFVALAVILIFGVVGFAMLGILANALSILSDIISFLAGNATALASSSPGVYPVLPYFTIPLVEGLIALFVLLVVHEGSHGISAIMSKIKVRSTGIITFGFVPVGAFVDIDEKQLDESKDIENARVSVAGSAANLFVSMLFFIPTILLILSLPSFQQPTLVVSSVAKAINVTGAPITLGTEIYALNGIPVNSSLQYVGLLENMTENTTISLSTSNGESTTALVADSMPGFIVVQPFKEDSLWVRPVFATLGLITVLNLLVGIINLLPIPSFDGHRLFKIAFKRKQIVNFITALVILSFLMNIVPWIWQ